MHNTAMTKMWKVVYGSPAPVEVEAKLPSWPNHDESGEKIYVNTHFLTLEAAWPKHLDEHRAGFSLTASRVKEMRQQLAEYEAKLVDASLAYAAALKAHTQFTQEGK